MCAKDHKVAAAPRAGMRTVVRRTLGMTALVTFSACGACEEPSDDAAAPAPLLGNVQPWTFGAARTEAALVLPPPCVEREPTLMAVLGRPTRLAAERHTLGRLWAAEGPSHQGRWRADAASIVPLIHGRTRPRSAPRPNDGDAVLTRSGTNWLFAHRDADQLHLWWRGASVPFAKGARAVDLDCRDARCALLLEHNDDVFLMLGDPDGSYSSWVRVDLGTFDLRPLGVDISDEGITVAMRDRLRVRFVHVGADGEPQRGPVLGATPALVAFTMRPAALLTEPPYQLIDGCANEGGVVLAVDGHAPTHLRSPQPPVSGALMVMQRGLLATWLAPTRCGSRRRMLHAAVVGHDGRAVAPVTTVGEADSVHVATQGTDVDLWLHRQAENTLTWVRASCR